MPDIFAIKSIFLILAAAPGMAMLVSAASGQRNPTGDG